MDDHATFLRNWAADIRKNSGQSVDADRLDEIAKVLSSAPVAVKGVDSQVLVAARDEGPFTGSPEWLWRSHKTGVVGFGRWSKSAGQAPYIRADLVLSALSPAPVSEPEPVAYASEYGLDTLSKRAHHYCLSLSKKPENEYRIPLYRSPLDLANAHPIGWMAPDEFADLKSGGCGLVVKLLEPSSSAVPVFTAPPSAERMLEALEPFADIADLIDSETEGFSDTDEFELLFGNHLMQTFTVEQFRRARAALAEKGGAE